MLDLVSVPQADVTDAMAGLLYAIQQLGQQEQIWLENDNHGAWTHIVPAGTIYEPSGKSGVVISVGCTRIDRGVYAGVHVGLIITGLDKISIPYTDILAMPGFSLKADGTTFSTHDKLSVDQIEFVTETIKTGTVHRPDGNWNDANAKSRRQTFFSFRLGPQISAPYASIVAGLSS